MKIAELIENGATFQHFGLTKQFKRYEARDGVIEHAEEAWLNDDPNAHCRHHDHDHRKGCACGSKS